jgi:hypothetical protein
LRHCIPMHRHRRGITFFHPPRYDKP